MRYKMASATIISILSVSQVICQPACMKLSVRVYVFVHFVSPSRIHAAA